MAFARAPLETGHCPQARHQHCVIDLSFAGMSWAQPRGMFVGQPAQARKASIRQQAQPRRIWYGPQRARRLVAQPQHRQDAVQLHGFRRVTLANAAAAPQVPYSVR
jgi:hypothetical protein